MDYGAGVGAHFDSSDDSVWITGTRNDKFRGLLALFPHGAFQKENVSVATCSRFRGIVGSLRYGLHDDGQEAKSSFRLHSLYIQRIATMIKYLFVQGGAVACAATPRRKGFIAAFGLEQLACFVNMSWVHFADSVMCSFGSGYPPSKLIWLYSGCNLVALPSRCTREVGKWTCSVIALFARHRPLHGGQSYETEHDNDAATVCATVSLLPLLLFRFLTVAFAKHIFSFTRPAHPSTSQQDEHSGLGGESLVWSSKLRGSELGLKAEADALAIGGLRNARQAVGKLHLVKQLVQRFIRYWFVG